MNPTSKIVALSSAIAFALQIALALLMLRYFSPEEVGTFSVISQIGFFWTTLALAQAPLQLLANQGVSVLEDARLAWVASIKRFIWLLPIAALAVWFSGMSFVSTLLWALLLSFCQFTWMLAQSMRLRMASVWGQAGVRVLPPLITLLATSMAICLQWGGFVLLSAALLGYIVGAAWFFPVFFAPANSNSVDKKVDPNITTTSDDQRILSTKDNRSTALRMLHTFVDALLATAVVVVWQRMYGAEETGWMAAPLRVMGFVPAVVHMAWSQVILFSPQHSRSNSLCVGVGGFVFVAILGAACALALQMNLLEQYWLGVEPYLFPLVLWQGCACIVAALSHLPFQTNKEKWYSWICIGIVTLQVNVLFLPIFFKLEFTASLHLLIFGMTSALALLCFGIYMHYSFKELPLQKKIAFSDDSFSNTRD